MKIKELINIGVNIKQTIYYKVKTRQLRKDLKEHYGFDVMESKNLLSTAAKLGINTSKPKE